MKTYCIALDLRLSTDNTEYFSTFINMGVEITNQAKDLSVLQTFKNLLRGLNNIEASSLFSFLEVHTMSFRERIGKVCCALI